MELTTEGLMKVDKWGRKCIDPSIIDPSIKRCYSPNLFSFFRRKSNEPFSSVIRHEGALWLAMIFEGPGKQEYWNKPYNEWIGLRVVSVACNGTEATAGWMTSQNRSGYEDVTEWFWTNYMREGMYGIYEVWHRSYPKQLTHREHSQL